MFTIPDITHHEHAVVLVVVMLPNSQPGFSETSQHGYDKNDIFLWSIIITGKNRTFLFQFLLSVSAEICGG